MQVLRALLLMVCNCTIQTDANASIKKESKHGQILPLSWTQTIEGFESKFALENKLTNCIDFSPNNKNEKANVKLDIVGTATSEDVSNHVQLQSMKLCITRV